MDVPRTDRRFRKPGQLPAAGLFLLLLTTACGSAAPGEKAASKLDPLLDGSAGRDLLEAISGVERLAGTPAFETALEEIANRLRSGGFVSGPIPPDGPLSPDTRDAYQFVFRDSLLYEIWSPVSATLEVLDTEPFVAADYRDTPISLALNSRATAPGGVVTRMINLGNGTFDQEYEGVNVRGAIVYGRRSTQAIYRAAVGERGAVGVVSPAAQAWHDTDSYPGLVAGGLVGREGFGFKISPEMAPRVEEVMARNGGIVDVRATVEKELLSGRELTTLVAEIPGRDPSVERVVLVAPMSGRAPGAGEVAGAAALLEVALALNRAISDGELRRPRRSVLFLWGASMQGINAWMRRFPLVAEQMHSVTALQLLGTDPRLGEPFALLERVPDPAALWTRPPFDHTAWGAARPPYWPFEGHYLSELTEAIAQAESGEGALLQVKAHPFEGAADHVPALDARVPAQRLWHFPAPVYQTSLDLPEHIRTDTLRRAALLAAAMAWELAEADVGTARTILRLIERRARERLEEVMAQAASNLGGGAGGEGSMGDRRLEEEIANAWKIWYLEAIESVMSHPIGERANELKGGVNLAVARLSREWDQMMLDLGLAPLPLPERFRPSKSYNR
jgi:hypothetical protein